MATPLQPSPGYVGMLGLTCLSMIIGIVAMALEANEYDWDPKPKATQTIALPKVVAALDADQNNSVLAAKPENSPELKPEPQKATDVAKTEPAAPVAPIAPVAPARPTETAKTEPMTVPPAATPTGPIPSPLAIPQQGKTSPTNAPKDTPKDVPNEEKPEAKPEVKPSGPIPSPLRIRR